MNKSTIYEQIKAMTNEHGLIYDPTYEIYVTPEVATRMVDIAFEEGEKVGVSIFECDDVSKAYECSKAATTRYLHEGLIDHQTYDKFLYNIDRTKKEAEEMGCVFA